MPDMELEADLGGLEARRVLELMHGVLRGVASAENPDDVLRVIVSDGLQWLQPVGAVLGRQVEAVTAVGKWGSSLELSADSVRPGPLARNAWSDAVRLCEAIWLPSIDERQARYPDLRVDDVVESLAVLPLVAHGAAFGVLGVAFAVPNRFDGTQRAFLVALADLCALWLLHPTRAHATARNGDQPTARTSAAMTLSPDDAAWPAPGSTTRSNGKTGLPDTNVKLTAREQEIAGALTRGKRSSAIARDLGISIYTVRKHISAILRKYEVASQGEVIARILGQWSRSDSGAERDEQTVV